MFPRVRVPPEEEDEAPPPPQPANTRIATTSADISASNLLLTLINLPSSANNSRGSISGRTAIRAAGAHFFAPDANVFEGPAAYGRGFETIGPSSRRRSRVAPRRGCP